MSFQGTGPGIWGGNFDRVLYSVYAVLSLLHSPNLGSPVLHRDSRRKTSLPVGLKPFLWSSRPDYASLSWFNESKNYSNTCNIAENNTWMHPVLSIHPCCWFIVSRIPGCGTSAGLALVVSSLIEFQFNLRFRSQSYQKYTKFQSSALWN